MKRRRADASAIQLPGHAIAAMPGSTEHNRRSCGVDRFCADVGAVSPGHAPEHVVGSADVGGLVTNLVTHRIALVVACQYCHVAVERGREQHGLALGGGLVEQAPHGRDESHVGHAVGLVDDDLVDSGQDDLALIDQVFKAAWARHENVDSATQGTDLGAVAHAAICDANSALAGKGSQLGHDLIGEFAGWREHECSGLVRLGAADAGNERNPERQRLAGSGGRAAADIASGQSIGHGGRLDGEGLVDATLSEGADDEVRGAQLGKGGGHVSPGPLRAGSGWVRWRLNRG